MYLNGRFLTQRVTGVQRFARETVSAASAHNIFSDGTSLLAPNSADIPASFNGFPVQTVGKLHGHMWEQLELPRVSANALLVNLCNTAPLLKALQLVVLHDAAVAALPQNFTPAFRAWYQLMIRCYGKSARKIATVSRFSADEITKYFGIPAQKIEIIPESGEHILRTPPDYSLHEKFALASDGYILAVSSYAPHKNFDSVVKAVARLPSSLKYKFVIVGGHNAKIFNAINSDISDAIKVGYATDAQLRALYERAACFAYPSLYEGFGIPPLEAMSCGCPVLVSNAASLPEICGNAAAYCNPYDPDDIAQQLSRILESAGLRATLRGAGLSHAKQWTWQNAALRLNDIIKIESRQ